MADASLGSATLHVKLDRSQLKTGLSQVKSETKSFVNDVNKNLATIGSTIGAGLLFRGLTSGLKSAAREYNSTQIAAELFDRQLKISNQNIQAGQQAIQTLADKLGLVPNQIKDSATQLLRAGYNIDQIKTIFEGGAASALAFGRTAQAGINNATDAIISQRSALLNMIGISQNLSTFYQQYAHSIGKTVDQLNAQEKAQATTNLFLVATKQEVKTLPTLLSGYAGAQNQLNKTLNEFRLSEGKLAVPIFTDLAKVATAVLNAVDDLPEPVKAAGTAFVVAGTGATVLAGGITALKIASSALFAPPAGLILLGVSAMAGLGAAALTTAHDKMPQLTKSVDDAADALGKVKTSADLKSTLDTLGNELTGPAKDAWNTYAKSIEKAGDDIDTVEQKAKAAAKTFAATKIAPQLNEFLSFYRQPATGFNALGKNPLAAALDQIETDFKALDFAALNKDLANFSKLQKSLIPPGPTGKNVVPTLGYYLNPDFLKAVSDAAHLADLLNASRSGGVAGGGSAGGGAGTGGGAPTTPTQTIADLQAQYQTSLGIIRREIKVGLISPLEGQQEKLDLLKSTATQSLQINVNNSWVVQLDKQIDTLQTHLDHLKAKIAAVTIPIPKATATLTGVQVGTPTIRTNTVQIVGLGGGQIKLPTNIFGSPGGTYQPGVSLVPAAHVPGPGPANLPLAQPATPAPGVGITLTGAAWKQLLAGEAAAAEARNRQQGLSVEMKPFVDQMADEFAAGLAQASFRRTTSVTPEQRALLAGGLPSFNTATPVTDSLQDFEQQGAQRLLNLSTQYFQGVFLNAEKMKGGFYTPLSGAGKQTAESLMQSAQTSFVSGYSRAVANAKRLRPNLTPNVQPFVDAMAGEFMTGLAKTMARDRQLAVPPEAKPYVDRMADEPTARLAQTSYQRFTTQTKPFRETLSAGLPSFNTATPVQGSLEDYEQQGAERVKQLNIERSKLAYAMVATRQSMVTLQRGLMHSVLGSSLPSWTTPVTSGPNLRLASGLTVGERQLLSGGLSQSDLDYYTRQGQQREQDLQKEQNAADTMAKTIVSAGDQFAKEVIQGIQTGNPGEIVGGAFGAASTIVSTLSGAGPIIGAGLDVFGSLLTSIFGQTNQQQQEARVQASRAASTPAINITASISQTYNAGAQLTDPKTAAFIDARAKAAVAEVFQRLGVDQYLKGKRTT